MDSLDQLELAISRKRLYGVYPAVVIDAADPDKQGRVRIRLPWAPDTGSKRRSDAYEAWARLAVPMAGNNRGTWFIPDIEDEVLVAFEAGDPRRPYVVGSLWNGQDAPPESMDRAGNNHIKSIVSRNGIRIELDDTDGKETLTLETPGGQKVTLKDDKTAIEISDSNGNSITLNDSGMSINTDALVTINATTITMSAAMVTVNAGMSTFSGVVKADTVISNMVSSGAYMPAAGNIW